MNVASQSMNKSTMLIVQCKAYYARRKSFKKATGGEIKQVDDNLKNEKR